MTYYYDKLTGNDTNPGTQRNPFKSFRRSVDCAQNGDELHIIENSDGKLLRRHNR